MTALGAAAVKNGGSRLRLHAGKEAVGLGAVAAVRLKGTLRHEKNSYGRSSFCPNFLAIATDFEYTREDTFFTVQSPLRRRTARKRPGGRRRHRSPWVAHPHLRRRPPKGEDHARPRLHPYPMNGWRRSSSASTRSTLIESIKNRASQRMAVGTACSFFSTSRAGRSSHRQDLIWLWCAATPLSSAHAKGFSGVDRGGDACNPGKGYPEEAYNNATSEPPSASLLFWPSLSPINAQNRIAMAQGFRPPTPQNDCASRKNCGSMRKFFRDRDPYFLFFTAYGATYFF
jgi:hypothetical protein